MAKRKPAKTQPVTASPNVELPTASDAPKKLIEESIAPEQRDIKEAATAPKIDSPEKQMSSATKLTEGLTKIKIATRTGIRTYALSRKRMEKYGAIPNKLVEGLKVYAQKIAVFYPESGITRKVPIAPEKREQYFYREDIKQYSKYVPEAQTTILLRDKKTGEEKIITTTQEKVRSGIYGVVETRGRGEGRTHIYERQKNVARRSATKEERKQIEEQGGIYPAGWQATAIWNMTVTHRDTGQQVFNGDVEGYSSINKEPRTEDEMISGERNSTYSSACYRLKTTYGFDDDDSSKYVITGELITQHIGRVLH